MMQRFASQALRSFTKPSVVLNSKRFVTTTSDPGMLTLKIS